MEEEKVITAEDTQSIITSLQDLNTNQVELVKIVKDTFDVQKKNDEQKKKDQGKKDKQSAVDQKENNDHYNALLKIHQETLSELKQNNVAIKSLETQIINDNHAIQDSIQNGSFLVAVAIIIAFAAHGFATKVFK